MVMILKKESVWEKKSLKTLNECAFAAHNSGYTVSLPLVASPKLLPSVATSYMLGTLDEILY